MDVHYEAPSWPDYNPGFCFHWGTCGPANCVNGQKYLVRILKQFKEGSYRFERVSKDNPADAVTLHRDGEAIKFGTCQVVPSGTKVKFRVDYHHFYTNTIGGVCVKVFPCQP